jgi:putative ABC transport system permease protein
MLPVPPSTWLVYGAALLALALIMWRLSLDLVLTFTLLGGGLIAALLLGGLLLLGLQSLRRLLAGASLPWRLGLGQLLRHPLAAAGQSLAFGLILLSMALIALLRGELLDTWQNQLPKDAPNYFALNILPAEKDAFAERLKDFSALGAPLYPVIPGRLTHINGTPVRQVVSKDTSGDRAIQRDLSLTWAAELPPGNTLVAGTWWNEQPADALPGVSVEAKVAESLKLTLGDQLKFSVGGMELSRAFPAVTILQVEALLEQLRSILAQVTLAVEYVLLFVLAAGLAVLFSGLQATLDERIQQGALLRALGAERWLLIKTRRIEFGLLGATSGLLAALGCEVISAVLYHYAFDLSWSPHPWLLALPVIGAVLVGGAGIFGTRRALNATPLTVLREG